MPRGDAYQLQGQEGGEVIADGDQHSGPYRWILVVEDAVIDDIASNLRGGAANLIGKTLAQGFAFGGVIASITLLSGTVIAYDA